ncbi:MAG: DUF4198 domain-containing protein [Planctomycetaceae bacterium]
MMKIAGLAGMWAALSVSAANAHDYWLQPKRFDVAVNMRVPVRLFVGDQFAREIERKFQRKPTLRFELVSKTETIDLAKTAKEDAKPYGQIRPAMPGTHWIALDRDVRHITLNAEKFARYLRHENLHAVLKARKAAGEEAMPGRERYSRYIKCLIHAGGKRDDTWKRVLKQRLEIVPLADPSAVRPGGKLKVRILFEGKPLAKAPVFALHKAEKRARTQSTTTDADGIAEFAINRKGVWLVRLVHMRRCIKCPKADWESFWGAMTFAVKK